MVWCAYLYFLKKWEDVRIVTENLSVHRETFSGN